MNEKAILEENLEMGRCIMELRLKQGLSIAELSRRSKTTDYYMIALENAEIRKPSFVVISAIADEISKFSVISSESIDLSQYKGEFSKILRAYFSINNRQIKESWFDEQTPSQTGPIHWRIQDNSLRPQRNH